MEGRETAYAAKGSSLVTAFASFAVLWSLATIANTWRHFDLSHGPLVYILEAATMAAALVVLARPSSLPRFGCLAAIATVTAWAEMPRINNHQALIFLLHLAALGAWGIAARRARRSSRRDPVESFHRAFVPAARYIVIVLYFWATVHKLNTSFVDPDLSCTTSELTKLRAHVIWGVPLSFLPAGRSAVLLASWGTIAVEGLLPLLLLLRRARLAGVWLALLFHLLLGLSYPGFSCMLFALLTLFLPGRYWAALHEALSRVRPSPALRLSASLGPPLLGAMLVVWTTMVAWNVDDASTALPNNYLRQFLVVYAVALIAGLDWLRRQVPRRATDPWSLGLHIPPALAPIALLTFINGLCPYVGLKTTLSFAMFSNLRTEGGVTNHFFVPAKWQIFDTQRDLVRIHDSSDPVLAWLARPNFDGAPTNRSFVTFNRRTPVQSAGEPYRWLLPYQALRQRVTHLAQDGEVGISLSYERDGEIITLEYAERDRELSTFPYLASKLLRMRAVPDVEGGCCMW